MATSPSHRYPTFDMAVPSDDITGDAITTASAQAALEIAGRAAWLAWQIDARQVNVGEARQQLAGIADDLARFGDRFPDDLRAQVLTAFETAQSEAANENLAAVAEASKRIRATMEQFHNGMLV